MREIKFRGYDEKNKEMVYNINLLFSNHLNECFEEYEECGLKIMQYTGLKDKNGVEIYEGDIVINRYGNYYTPIYQNGIYMAYNPNKIHKDLVVTQFNIIVREGCEVVRNIYENRELLEVE